MARPIKEGMDYFPHDTDAANDEKIEILRSLHGNDGYAFYFILLERIYRMANFEIIVSDAETLQILARKVAVTPQKLSEMIQTAIKYSIFDPKKYQNEGVLTSNGIKKRSQMVIEKREDMRKKYHKEVSGVISDAETGVETPQSKVKESKVKESKERHSFDFESLWIKYPNKDGKRAAERHFKNDVKTEQDWKDISTALDNYLQSDVVKKGFIKNGSTWFNNWRDWIVPPKKEVTDGIPKQFRHLVSNSKSVSIDNQ